MSKSSTEQDQQAVVDKPQWVKIYSAVVAFTVFTISSLYFFSQYYSN